MDEDVGQVSYDMPEPGQMVLGKPYSQATAKIIDDRARTLVEEAYEQATDLLVSKKEDCIKVPCM